MSAQLLVLTSGEKIICTVEPIESSAHTQLLLKRPLCLKEMITQEGVSYILLPFLPIKGDNIVINASHIAVPPVEADPRLSDQYAAQTSSLVLPTGNRIGKPTIEK